MQNPKDTTRTAEHISSATTSNKQPPRITSRSLFGASSEVVIEHDGQEYRLRITRHGKLILTK